MKLLGAPLQKDGGVSSLLPPRRGGAGPPTGVMSEENFLNVARLAVRTAQDMRAVKEQGDLIMYVVTQETKMKLAALRNEWFSLKPKDPTVGHPAGRGLKLVCGC